MPQAATSTTSSTRRWPESAPWSSSAQAWTPGPAASPAVHRSRRLEVDLPVNTERKTSRRGARAWRGAAHRSTWYPSTSNVTTSPPSSSRPATAPPTQTFFVMEGVTQYLTEDGAARHVRVPPWRRNGQQARVHLRPCRISSTATTCTAPQLLYKRFRQRQQLWKFGLDPDHVAAFVGEYGWQARRAGGRRLLHTALHQADRTQSVRNRSRARCLLHQHAQISMTVGTIIG